MNLNSYTHIYYDLFASYTNQEKPGIFLDIGCNLPGDGSNVTKLLEEGWTGTGVDIQDYGQAWSKYPGMKFLMLDVSKKSEMNHVFKNLPKVIDFLSFDIDHIGLIGCSYIDFEKFKFRTICMEHDGYRFPGYEAGQSEILKQAGYVKVLKTPADHFWVHPDLIPSLILTKLQTISTFCLNDKEVREELLRIINDKQ